MSCTRGPYTEEKAQELGRVWAILLDLRHPGLDLGNLTGFMKAEPVMETGETVNLRGLRSLTRTESAQSEQDVKIYTFATGDAVTAIRKMTGEFPTSKNPGHRKNLDKGLDGDHRGMGRCQLCENYCDVVSRWWKGKGVHTHLYPEEPAIHI